MTGWIPTRCTLWLTNTELQGTISGKEVAHLIQCQNRLSSRTHLCQTGVLVSCESLANSQGCRDFVTFHPRLRLIIWGGFGGIQGLQKLVQGNVVEMVKQRTNLRSHQAWIQILKSRVKSKYWKNSVGQATYVGVKGEMMFWVRILLPSESLSVFYLLRCCLAHGVPPALCFLRQIAFSCSNVQYVQLLRFQNCLSKHIHMLFFPG